MDYVKMVLDLCEIIEAQNKIIRAQAIELAQHCTVTRAEEIAALDQKYSDVMGEGVTGT